MNKKNKKNPKEITQKVKKIRDFLSGFSAFITVTDITLFSILYGLGELEENNIGKTMLLNLLEKVETQCNVLKSNISELKQLLQQSMSQEI